MQTREFVVQARIDVDTLHHWLQAGWLCPRENGEGSGFSQVDLARAQLIGDLQNLGINDEGIPVILDLVDQLHGLRSMLRELLTAIKESRQERRRT
jgi:chaperone modulatory protein CbpM